MQYAERLPTLPSPRTMVAPVVALLVGAGVATGAYALLDDDKAGFAPATTKVIVAEQPAQPGAGVAAKNESGVAATIAESPVGSGTETKNEAGVASAIAQPSGASGTQTKNEAGVASAIAQPSSASATATKNEAGVAAAIAQPSGGPVTETKDEAGTAAAVGHSWGAELRGSKASEYGTSQYRFAERESGARP
jgi:hypothetical protein